MTHNKSTLPTICLRIYFISCSFSTVRSEAPNLIVHILYRVAFSTMGNFLRAARNWWFGKAMCWAGMHIAFKKENPPPHSFAMRKQLFCLPKPLPLFSFVIHRMPPQPLIFMKQYNLTAHTPPEIFWLLIHVFLC